MHTFLRPAGETAKFVSYDLGETNTTHDIIRTLRHGDLLYQAHGYRSSETFVVVDSDTEGAGIGVPCIANSASYGEIPSWVTVDVEDPVAFYASVIGKYRGAATIHIDCEKHQHLLQKQTGGRPVDESRVVWWESSGAVETGSYYIQSSPSPDIPGGTVGVELNSHTPNEYLISPRFGLPRFACVSDPRCCGRST